MALALTACAGPQEAEPKDTATASDDTVSDSQPGDDTDSTSSGSADTASADGGNAGAADAATPPQDSAAEADTSPQDTAPPVPTVRVRVVAANLSSGNKQSYDPGHGARILRGLAPDIVLIQEFNVGDNSAKAVAGFVTQNFGADFHHYREGDGAKAWIPNGIISRYPIVASGSWDDALSKNREFAWARIDVPGPRDLWAVSLHLLTKNSTTRAKEITQLKGYIAKHVPADDLLVVGGDLNTQSFGETSLQAFGDLLDRSGKPVDQAGNGHTNGPRNKPYDRLFADADLQALHTPVSIGQQSFPEGLVFDSRVYQPLADVSPVKVGDSGATAMQHMAVVRDFALPVP